MLNKKKICSQELIGFATAMRKISTKVDVNDKVIDSCGTGGDGIGTFNISTCASFIAAACDVKVASLTNFDLVHGGQRLHELHEREDLLLCFDRLFSLFLFLFLLK